MELLQKKHDLLLRFRDNELLIKKLIEEDNFEYVLKRLEQNNFLIRQIDEIDSKLKMVDDIDETFKGKVSNLTNEIRTLHQDNIGVLNVHFEKQKKEALKSNQSKKPIRAYTSNLK